MKRSILGVFLVLIAFVLMGCPNPEAPETELTASTIVFADGLSVSKVLGSGSYTNTVSGVGSGTVTYTSGTPSTATVNAATYNSY